MRDLKAKHCACFDCRNDTVYGTHCWPCFAARRDGTAHPHQQLKAWHERNRMTTLEKSVCPSCEWDLTGYSMFHRKEHIRLCSHTDEQMQAFAAHVDDDRHRDWERYL